MDNQLILTMEIIGIPFISISGVFLHFTFELGRKWKPLAIISAVNESVWEHLKIGFWPAFIWGLLELFIFGREVPNFYFAKSITFILIPVIIIILFYSYTFFINHILIIDVFIFFIAIASAQLVGYRLMLLEKSHLFLDIIGLLLIFATITSFSIFSFFPLKLEIFRDSYSGEYGILRDKDLK